MRKEVKIRMFKPANRTTLHDNVLSQLIEGIKQGQWKPGEKLPGEMVMAQQFKVSRNCIREVLKALALADIIEAHPGSGTFVTPHALQNLEGPQLASSVIGNTSLWELKDIRGLLEGHAAYLAAQLANDEQIEKLHKALEPQLKENITESHAGFHKVLLEIANNQLLSRILASVQKEMDLLRAKYGRLPQGILDTYTVEHAEIYQMVKAHQPEAARDAMLRHIDAAWTDTLYEDVKEK